MAPESFRWEPGPGDLPFLVVDTPLCRARLTRYGGQLCEWQPAGEPEPVLFMSPRSSFAVGKAIRGGVPVCFPWFGDHPTDRAKSGHGFARTRLWETEAVERQAGGDLVVAFRVASNAETRALWEADFEARLELALGATLTMRFEVENRGVEAIRYEVALHSYFAVGDVEAVRVRGLEGTRFIDKVDAFQEKTHGREPVALAGETDRVFLETSAACVVDDPTFGRSLRIEKSGSRATVVWNPGPAKARTMADVGDAWRGFVCVEAANCRPHAVELAPGARHAMRANVTVAR